MDLMEKYKHNIAIRHDREILQKFCDDLSIAFKNQGIVFSLVEKDKFIDCWLEGFYFKKRQEE
jgi:hypothetical protein